jgi:CheY-like chemotaxis protein
VDKKKILVVEDNPTNMELFMILFEGEGYIIHKAINGKEGLDKAVSEQFDLIVLDPGLPDFKGKEILKALRDIPTLEHCIIVICSANVSRDSQKELLASGGNHFIGKPIDTALFLSDIARLLKKPGASPS